MLDILYEMIAKMMEDQVGGTIKSRYFLVKY